MACVLHFILIIHVLDNFPNINFPHMRIKLQHGRVCTWYRHYMDRWNSQMHPGPWVFVLVSPMFLLPRTSFLNFQFLQICNTVNEQVCSTVNEQVCQPSYSTRFEQQCSTVFEEQCASTYEEVRDYRIKREDGIYQTAAQTDHLHIWVDFNKKTIETIVWIMKKLNPNFC